MSWRLPRLRSAETELAEAKAGGTKDKTTPQVGQRATGQLKMIFSQKLQHELPCRFEKIETARTPPQKHLARQEGLSVRADLEKQISDDAALAAFKAAQPQSSFGVWKGLVHDRPVFMTGPAGTKITGSARCLMAAKLNRTRKARS
jgi:hypothetical protein